MSFKRTNAAKATLTLSAILAASIPATAQGVVQIGGGSLASEPPTYSLVQGADGGWNSQSTIMLSRKIYADELPPTAVDGLQVPVRPIPTNDWWTDIINNRYSGALWSYPAMVNTAAEGVEVCYPSYWADAAKEVKSKSSVTVTGAKFTADATIAQDWSDWSVTFRMPQQNGKGKMEVTLAHGMPFSWFEFTEMNPIVKFNIRAVDTAVTTAYPADTKPELFGAAAGRLGVKFGDELYGFYFPAGSECSLNADGELELTAGTKWLVVALLRDRDELAAYDAYAVSIPRKTEVSWNYDEARAVVNTQWNVTAENLRDSGGATKVLQGFLPHVYKHAMAGASLSFTGKTYLTPRGTMKLAASDNGTFAYSYQFTGMLPAYAAPKADDSEKNGFDQAIMDRLMETYAKNGTFGGDTYWGGKGLTQMALNMSFARQTGNTELYELSKSRLREALENWLTYTPGEENYYLSYFRRWGGILGFAVSYGSDTFNDHHFHYGYFTYAAALLCMEDREFAEKYGDMLTLLAKDYANWDKEDKRFPFLRTLDPWCGHSWAGGLGDAGNDNGNGQESTSESMQAWGGIYLLGVALGNKEMRDAGLFGWNTEARATREYWYDVDQPRPANEGGRKPWPGKNNKDGNYDYSQYPYAYNSNITGKGIGWWTWFGGDPLFMHGIQWMPISPALDYLSWDTDFVKWAYEDMMSGANSTYSHKWFEETTNTADGSAIEPLAKNDWGNVTLAYLQRTDPQLAADIFKEALDKELHIATSVSTSHISYYTTHFTLTYGEPDRNYHASTPTATVFTKNGKQTFMAYNPGTEEMTVTFYDTSGAPVKTVTVAPGQLTAFDQGDPEATALEAASAEGDMLPPGATSAISARVLDQYGAGMKGARISYTLSANAPASMNGQQLKINANAARGTKFTLTVKSGTLSEALSFTVNDKPVPQTSRLEGLTPNAGSDILTLEVGSSLDMSLVYTDQYGKDTTVENAEWSYTTSAGATGTASARFTPAKPGVYTITAKNAAGTAKAEGKVFITPALPLISAGATATSSSEENAGSLTVNVNDGDIETRWGSQHTDSEWIYLDLGSDQFVSRVGIVWEPAYASEYEIQIAPDGCAMTNHTGKYAGVEKTVKVPSEDAWTASVTQRLSGYTKSEISSLVNATGRYVRMRGVARGSAYGYSIYEMNVYGLDDKTPSDALLGIDFSMPQAMDEGETIAIAPVAYTRAGTVIEDVALTWSADKKATFDGNSFTPLSHGVYTITGTTADGKKSTGTIFVNESVKLRSLTLTPAETEMVEGYTVKIDYTAYNQFSAPYEMSDADLTVTVLDAEGKPTADATYDKSSRLFSSSVAAAYTVRFTIGAVSADATVVVKRISDANLALNKSISASSSVGQSTASCANDGNIETRWESNRKDGETITLDLGEAFDISRIYILWEAAYAKEYRIEASLDGEYWRTITTDNANSTLENTIDYDLTQPARWLRIDCDKRATEYGFSIKEWEVYGTSRFTAVKDSNNPEIGNFTLTPGNGMLTAAATATTANRNLTMTLAVKDADGNVLRSVTENALSGQEISTTVSDLKDGTYTVVLTATDIYGQAATQEKSAEVTVLPIGSNLALNKSAWASTEDGGMAATMVTDGRNDGGFRWKSFATAEDPTPWVVVDLGNTYQIHHLKLYWEGAYASDYEIMTAIQCEEGTDNGDFATAFHRQGFILPTAAPAQGPTRIEGVAASDEINFAPVIARYVMMKANKPATVYGASLWELEAYGVDTPVGIDEVGGDFDPADDIWYTPQGIRVDDTNLSDGIYIRVRNGKAAKILIRR